MEAVILYVEDNPQNMRLVRKMLTADGFYMLEAMDGHSALHIIEQQIPHLILMDINLPDIDGTTLASTIKNDSRWAHIPIIALTANAMYGDKERILNAGCDGYIAKPVSRRELLSVVGQFLSSNS